MSLDGEPEIEEAEKDVELEEIEENGNDSEGVVPLNVTRGESPNNIGGYNTDRRADFMSYNEGIAV